MKKNRFNNITRYIYVLIVFVFILYSNCQKEKISVREYPRIEISDEVIQNESGITFTGNITTEGSSRILDKGFVWSSTEMPTILSPRVFLGEHSGLGQFEGTAHIDLVAGSNYTVRAFIKTVDYLVYSNAIQFDCSFTSPSPQIVDFNPKQAKWGDTIRIEGQNFSFLINNIDVLFGELNTQIISCSDTTIFVTVPDKLNNSSVHIKANVYNNTVVSKEEFYYINPEIQDFSPKNGTFHDTLTITGIDFPDNRNYCKVKVGGIEASIIENSSSQIKVIVPAEIPSLESDVLVSISGINKIFSEKFLLHSATITNFTPKEVFQPNTTVSIFGNNFNPISKYNIVYLGNTKAEIFEASSTELKIIVPENVINDPEITTFDTLAVSVTTAGQAAFAVDSLYLSYLARWTKKKDFPGQSRAFAVSFSYNGKGYYGMGRYDAWTYFKDIWEYNPDIDTWVQKSSFPGTAEPFAASFVIDSKLYVYRGWHGTGFDLDENEFWEYNTLNDTWTKKNDFPGDPRFRAFGFSSNGKGYIGGGLDESFEPRYDFWEYDAENDNWAQKGDIPNIAGTSYHDDINAFASGDYGYILGLIDYPESREFWKYDVITDSWVQVSKMPAPYWNVTAFSLNDNLYVGTGINSDNQGSGLYKYEQQTDNWTSIGFKGPWRKDASSFAIGNKGYILGGIGYSNIILRDIWQFDPTK